MNSPFQVTAAREKAERDLWCCSTSRKKKNSNENKVHSTCARMCKYQHRNTVRINDESVYQLARGAEKCSDF